MEKRHHETKGSGWVRQVKPVRVTMKAKVKKRQPKKPPNLAAKALANGLFRPKIEKNPDAYTRRQRHKPPQPSPQDDFED